MAKIKYCRERRKAVRSLQPLLRLFNSGKEFPLALDIETRNATTGNGLDVHLSRIRTIQLKWCDKYEVVLDMLYLSFSDVYFLKLILESPRVTKIIHHAAFEFKNFLNEFDVRIHNMWDTMLTQQVRYAGLRSYGFGLDDVVKEELNVTLSKEVRASDWNQPNLDKAQIKYAARDVRWLIPLYKRQKKALDKKQIPIVKMENEAAAAFSEMELNGVEIDRKRIERVKDKYETKIHKLITKLQKGLPWVEIPKADLTKAVKQQFPNHTRPIGMGFKEAKCIRVKNLLLVKDAKNDIKKAMALLNIELPLYYDKTKKTMVRGLTLENVHNLNHPLAQTMKIYFQTVSMYNKYISKMEDWIHPKTGRVHPSVSQLKVTGRISLSDPPLQQMPRKNWFRNLFKAKDGYVFLKADYSQLELRLMAELSRDENMVQEYSKGLDADIHTKTAIYVFAGGNRHKWESFSPDKKKKKRQDSKPCNFGLIYGQGPIGFKNHLHNYEIDWELDKCERVINKWFQTYQRVREYQNRIKKAVRDAFKICYNRKTGEYTVEPYRGANQIELTTLAGRPRYWSTFQMIRQKIVGVNFSKDTGKPYIYVRAQEMFNHPVQGSGADAIKLAMVRINKILRKRNIPAKIILQVHDELVLEVKKGSVKRTAKIVECVMREEMQKFVKSVPIYVDVSYGTRWGNTKELKIA